MPRKDSPVADKEDMPGPPIHEVALDEIGQLEDKSYEASMETMLEGQAKHFIGHPDQELRQGPESPELLGSGPGLPLDALVTSKMAAVREELLLKFQSLSDTIMTIAADRQNGISAQMVGGFFNCPKCGLRISGPSLTSSQKDGFYEHSFEQSPKLSGKQCELKGVKFKAPIIFLESVKALTPKGE